MLCKWAKIALTAPCGQFCRKKSILSQISRYIQKPWVHVEVRSAVQERLPKLLQFLNILIISKVTELAVD